MKFTKREIEAVKPAEKRQYFFDDSFPGFALRVSEKGVKSFWYTYRVGKGRSAEKKWVHLGKYPAMTVEQARQLCKEKAAVVAMGEDPAATLQEEKTALFIAEALDAFQEEYVPKLKPSSIAFYKIAIEKHLKPAVGRLQAKKMGYSEAARFHASMKDKPYMANRCIAVLSVFLNWCELHGYRDKHTNPCKEIKLYKEIKRQEFMGAAELGILGDTLDRMEKTWHERKEAKTRRSSEIEGVDAITPHAAAALRLLLFTGARRGEILSLKWSYLDLGLGIARLPDSKTGFKVVQLPAPAVVILEGLPRISEFVFPAASATGHMVSIRQAWMNVLKQARLTGWRIHDLRHALASMMINSGASLPIVGKILGHTQASTTQRYAHLEDNPARKALEIAAAKIDEAKHKTSSNVIHFAKAGGASA
jgi:integrase